MVYMVAEIGVNHNGDPELLSELISAAKVSGADACKFQTFRADRLARKDTPKVKYQLVTSDPEETHWKMLKDLEFSEEMHESAMAACTALGMEFISTPYDPISVEYLSKLGVKTVKTASADVVDHRIHKKIVECGMRPIVAVGMASMSEIKSMLRIYEDENIKPTLLHCVSNYPCSFESINLSCLNLLKNEFNCPVGFSDHSVDSTAASLSVAFGAQVIEKHFTLDKSMKGPDHKASSTPEEFRELVDAVRRAEVIIGSAEKKLQAEEEQMHSVSRKSVVLKTNLTKGQAISEEMITMMRPGDGLNGDDYFKLIGRIAKKDLNEGHLVSWDDVE